MWCVGAEVAPPLLQVQGVTRAFPRPRREGGGWLRACHGVSFELGRGEAEIVSLVGESGAGKSTLARLILGLDRPDSGVIRYRGRDLATVRGRQWLALRQEVQAVFQDPYGIYNPFYRVDRVLEQPLRRFGLAAGRADERRRMEEALRAVDLRPEDVLGRYPHQLSGGERQRIMLARLYLIRPRLVVADEPVSMIDAALRTMFLNILLDLRAQGMSCLFITHNLHTAFYLGGRCLVLYRGQLVETGEIDRLIAQPAHPYTQMLMESVPSADPERRWAEELPDQAMESGRPAPLAACAFADRCPKVMPICQRQRPGFYDVQPGQAAACFLYAGEGAASNGTAAAPRTAVGSRGQRGNETGGDLRGS